MRLFSPLSAIACAVVLLSACTETTAVAPAARPLPGMPIAASMTQLAAALPHGTPLEVQSVVDGGDPRADVVTLATAVHFAPDLVASRLDAPANAPVGAAVNLQGFVLERNGEVGARADCVLYVDGAAAARAPRIWVD